MVFRLANVVGVGSLKMGRWWFADILPTSASLFIPHSTRYFDDKPLSFYFEFFRLPLGDDVQTGTFALPTAA